MQLHCNNQEDFDGKATIFKHSNDKKIDFFMNCIQAKELNA